MPLVTITSAAQFAAANALLLLAAAILLLGLSALLVSAAARAADRYSDTIWRTVDAVVPGELRRPASFLAVHLALAMIVILGGMAFAELADEVFDQEAIAAFDVAFADALYASASPRWRQLFRVITMFGNASALAPVIVAVGVMLFVTKRKLLGYAWAFSQAGGALLNYGLKVAFERARPPYADPELAARSFSFPSGHAMMTFVFCGMAAYLLIRTRRSWTQAAAIAALVLAWCLLMGFSRLYLGQHYLSDVVAGLCAGAAWVAACASGTEVALRRASRRVETRS